MTTHKEDVKQKEIATTHVIHIKGGVKVLTYIPADKVEHILTQMKANHGQLSVYTSNAIAHSVAAALVRDDQEIQDELSKNEHHFSDPDYDFEESDDDRTAWPPDEEE